MLIYWMSRFLPRRSGGGLAAYDFVFFWMMGGLAVAPLYDLKIRFVDTVAAVGTVYACHYLMSGLERALLPLEILLTELRIAGAGRVSEVETAMMETTGHVSIVKKSDHLPVTSGDVQKGGTDHPLPVVLVADGKMQRHGLEKLSVQEDWLTEKLNKAGAPGPSNLFAAIWEGTEPIYWSPKSGVSSPSRIGTLQAFM